MPSPDYHYPPAISSSSPDLAKEAAEAALPGAGSWYAIRVRSKFENAAFAGLTGRGYEAFLPLCRSRRRWSDRVKELDLPLFPGYLFCRFDAQDRLLPILTAPGVVAIVGVGKIPVSIDEREIADIRAILRSGLAAHACPYVGVGSRVRIEEGPLAGLEGFVTNTDKVLRLIVSVNLLQRSVAVEIDRDCLRPLSPGIGPRNVSSVGRFSSARQSA